MQGGGSSRREGGRESRSRGEGLPAGGRVKSSGARPLGIWVTFWLTWVGLIGRTRTLALLVFQNNFPCRPTFLCNALPPALGLINSGLGRGWGGGGAQRRQGAAALCRLVLFSVTGLPCAPADSCASGRQEKLRYRPPVDWVRMHLRPEQKKKKSPNKP